MKVYYYGQYVALVVLNLEQAQDAAYHVTRWLTVMDGGRMINAKTARNQIIAGVVMGISMGLFGETVYDMRNGKPVITITRITWCR
jgi:CO/xanthine dehydrogenase Mo-binding subunit